MNRHLARTLAMQTLYEWDFQPEKTIQELISANIRASDNEDEDTTFVSQLVNGVIEHRQTIDDAIGRHAPEWPLDQISVIDKSILRLAIYELLFEENTPGKVIINEAVELAKTFGGDNTSRFINGVLGTVYRETDRFKTESNQTESE